MFEYTQNPYRNPVGILLVGAWGWLSKAMALRRILGASIGNMNVYVEYMYMEDIIRKYGKIMRIYRKIIKHGNC